MGEVLEGSMSMDEAAKYAKTTKQSRIVKKAFLEEVGLDTWEEAAEKVSNLDQKIKQLTQSVHNKEKPSKEFTVSGCFKSIFNQYRNQLLQTMTTDPL